MLKTFFKTIQFWHVTVQDLVLPAISPTYSYSGRADGNIELWNVFIKDPKYKQTNNISWEKAKFTIIEEEFNDSIDSWYSKYGIKNSVDMEWKGKVIDKVDEKIKILSNKTSSKFHESVLH